ncbi:MAG TPA: hypothetical protein VJ438_03175 [Candidatus Nanoarchaeia archaeon]|nr:hypothetical protein [Candidatus Nanoarchaeia archaeon]
MTKIIKTINIDKEDIETLTTTTKGQSGQINIIEYSYCKDCGKELKIEFHLIFKQ